MKAKALIWILILLLSISIVGCTEASSKAEGELQKPASETQNNDETTVNGVVENFGKKLQAVSLWHRKMY